jgi:hypothetical protein
MFQAKLLPPPFSSLLDQVQIQNCTSAIHSAAPTCCLTSTSNSKHPKLDASSPPTPPAMSLPPPREQHPILPTDEIKNPECQPYLLPPSAS